MISVEEIYKGNKKSVSITIGSALYLFYLEELGYVW
jgi:hypothetical protein